MCLGFLFLKKDQGNLNMKVNRDVRDEIVFVLLGPMLTIRPISLNIRSATNLKLIDSRATTLIGLTACLRVYIYIYLGWEILLQEVLWKPQWPFDGYHPPYILSSEILDLY